MRLVIPPAAEDVTVGIGGNDGSDAEGSGNVRRDRGVYGVLLCVAV